MTHKRAPEDFDVVIKRSLYSMPTCLVLGASRRQCTPKTMGHGTFGLGWLLTHQKKCVAPRAVSSRQNLFVGCVAQDPEAFNNAKVAFKIQQMSRACCPEKKKAATRAAEATRRPMILADLSRIVQL